MFILLKILESQACQFFSIIREIFSYSYLMPDLFMDFCREYNDVSFG